jgi:hypothetical protein
MSSWIPMLYGFALGYLACFALWVLDTKGLKP